MPGKHYQYLFN